MVSPMKVTRKLASKSKASQSGFTMVELIIAVGLSAGLLFGVLQIFDSNRQSSRMQAGFSEVQEGGRIAVEMLTRDIRMAGSWGCYYVQGVDTSSSTNLQLHSAPTGVKADWGRSSVEAFNNAASSTVGGKTTIAGTDRFKIHGAYGVGNAQVRQPYGGSTASDIIINTGSTSIPAGTEIIISDCTGADIFANTELDTENSGTISHAANLRGVYTANSRIAIPFTHEFFIADNNAGGSSLFRLRNNDPNADELVRNVTDMQVTYGVGTDGSASKFIDAPLAAEFEQIISMRVQLTLDSQDNLNGGAPLQRTYFATANIRNKSIE
ncbi:hypothetical protein NBRC116493_05560 [Aurantivibrio infirmus]